MSRFIENRGLNSIRKRVAAGTLAGLITVTGAGVLNNSIARAETTSPSPSTSESTSETPGFINLSAEQDLSLKNENLSWTPDGHLPYITFSNGLRRYFITAARTSYAIDTNGESLNDAISSGRVNQDIVKSVYSPEQNPGYNYSGITAVFGLDQTNEQHLTALLHEEEYANPNDGSGFRASVGSVESFDGGLTWTNKKVLIIGDDIANPGERVSGAGQPDAIQIGDYLYIYYTDWSAQKTEQHPDQIYLARVKFEAGTIDSNVDFYTENGFVAGQDSQLKPVIPVSENIPDASYSALPSISFNTYLNKYLCIFETNVGFAQTTSVDGINWDKAILFASFPQSQADRQTTNIWYSYPTLVSDQTQPSDHVTTNSGTLYYSKGVWNTAAHELVSRNYSMK